MPANQYGFQHGIDIMKKLTLAVAMLLTTLGLQASTEQEADAIAKRIAPVGQVYVAGAAAATE